MVGTDSAGRATTRVDHVTDSPSLRRTKASEQVEIGYERSKIKGSHRKSVRTLLHHYISHQAIDSLQAVQLTRQQ